jgi:deazaflavin-dependent oxidoreductase (nitroreductase family)
MVSDERLRAPRLPPRWFVRLVWSAHRAVCRVTGGRVGLWRPKRGRWGTARLTTTGRRTNKQRSVIVGYIEDGPNVITLAMNGWADREPAWWLNLQTHPEARVDLVEGTRAVGRAPPREKNGHACGPSGATLTGTWTPMRPCGPPRLRSCFWNRGRCPPDDGGPTLSKEDAERYRHEGAWARTNSLRNRAVQDAVVISHAHAPL